MYDPSPRSEEVQGIFISGKLPMSEGKGSIFVEYTIVAVVHITRIYYGDVILVLHTLYYTTKTCNYVCLILTVSLCEVILQHFEELISNHVRSRDQ